MGGPSFDEGPAGRRQRFYSHAREPATRLPEAGEPNLSRRFASALARGPFPLRLPRFGPSTARGAHEDARLGNPSLNLSRHVIRCSMDGARGPAIQEDA